MQPFAVEPRADAALGGEELVAVRIEHRADRRHAVDLERQRGAEDRNAVRVVGRAVQRIEDPAIARLRAGLAHLFGEHDVIGKALRHERAEHALDFQIDFGDEIDGAFLVDVDVGAEALR